MSDGFPTRPSRDEFGPDIVDVVAPPNDEDYVGAARFNLSFWQLAGCSVCTPRAWAVVSAAGALTAAAEAWDANGQSAPTASKEADGHFRLVYDATYPDRGGTAVAPNLVGATISPGGTGTVIVPTWTITNGRQVDVYICNTAGAAVNAAFHVAIW